MFSNTNIVLTAPAAPARGDVLSTHTDSLGRQVEVRFEVVLVGKAGKVGHKGTHTVTLNAYGEETGSHYAAACGAEFGKGGRGKRTFSGRAPRGTEVTCTNCTANH